MDVVVHRRTLRAAELRERFLLGFLPRLFSAAADFVGVRRHHRCIEDVRHFYAAVADALPDHWPDIRTSPMERIGGVA